jgi:hypothetical protein
MMMYRAYKNIKVFRVITIQQLIVFSHITINTFRVWTERNVNVSEDGISRQQCIIVAVRPSIIMKMHCVLCSAARCGGGGGAVPTAVSAGAR